MFLWRVEPFSSGLRDSSISSFSAICFTSVTIRVISCSASRLTWK